jgi:hypothetical protein
MVDESEPSSTMAAAAGGGDYRPEIRPSREPTLVRAIEVPKFADLTDASGFRFTLYTIRVVRSDGRVFSIGRRYNEVLEITTRFLRSQRGSRGYNEVLEITTRFLRSQRGS